MVNAFGFMSGKKALCKYAPLNVENRMHRMVEIEIEFMATIDPTNLKSI
jgi:hypothetical protein